MKRNLLLWRTGTVIVNLDIGSTGRSRNVTSLLTLIHVALLDRTLAGEYIEQVVLLLDELIPLTLLHPPVQFTLLRLRQKL